MLYTERQSYSFKNLDGSIPALQLFTEVATFINCICFLLKDGIQL